MRDDRSSMQMRGASADLEGVAAAERHLRSLGLPVAPQGWYYACASSDLKRGGTFPVGFHGHDLIVFRSESGKLGGFSARCLHMGADLKGAQVCGESLRCPFHHWKFDRQGHCTEVPGEPVPSRVGKLRSYHVEERQGAVFLYSGSVPLFDLPFFDNRDPEEYLLSRPLQYDIDVPWYAAPMNGWDLRHFEIVHGRRLTRPAEVTEPGPHCLRIVLHTEISGHALIDRALKAVNGKDVRLEMTCFRGNYMLAHARFGRVTSYMLFSIHPQPGMKCRAHLFAFSPRRSGWGPAGALVQSVELALRRMLTDMFFRNEAHEFKGVHYREATLTDRDWATRAYVSWLQRVSMPDVAGTIPLTTQRSPTSPKKRPASRNQPSA